MSLAVGSDRAIRTIYKTGTEQNHVFSALEDVNTSFRCQTNACRWKTSQYWRLVCQYKLALYYKISYLWKGHDTAGTCLPQIVASSTNLYRITSKLNKRGSFSALLYFLLQASLQGVEIQFSERCLVESILRLFDKLTEHLFDSINQHKPRNEDSMMQARPLTIFWPLACRLGTHIWRSHGRISNSHPWFQEHQDVYLLCSCCYHIHNLVCSVGLLFLSGHIIVSFMIICLICVIPRLSVRVSLMHNRMSPLRLEVTFLILHSENFIQHTVSTIRKNWRDAR